MTGQWSGKTASLFLLATTLCTLALFGAVCFWKEQQRRSRIQDSAYRLTTIVQTGPEKSPLPTKYLAEVLGLSRDVPVSLYSLDLEECARKLEASPYIEKALCKRLPPNALYIEYTVRHPIAYLADYDNMAISAEGYLFPIAPFFGREESLPEIYLGLPSFESPPDSQGRSGGTWTEPVQNRYWTLALQVLEDAKKVLDPSVMRLLRIDVSQSFADSSGQREIVLCTEERVGAFALFPKIVRLHPQKYSEEIDLFLALCQKLQKAYVPQLAQLKEPKRFTSRIVDLRLPQLGFVENH